MTQKPFTTDKGEFLAIELPEGAPEIPGWVVRVFGRRIVRHNDEIVLDDKLPSGDWQIITPNASEATEEQARVIVCINSRKRYTDYYYDHVGFDMAKNSLQSLLRKLGLTGTVTVLKKVK